jgi:hypothetical protein
VQCFTDDQLARALQAVIAACDRDLSPTARRRRTRLTELRDLFLQAARDDRPAPEADRSAADRP